jgi:molybdopterin-guanine dinucleotide biosynthesis protein A
MGGYAAVVLAGGAGRRLGGTAKPLTAVAGRPMLDRVLLAVADADPRVVVGPPTLPVPPGVRLVSEQPPGGGPVAGLAAGLSTVDGAAGPSPEAGQSTVDRPEVLALLAADLPFLTRRAIAVLQDALSTMDGAIYVDDTGRRQTLCGVWRIAALRRRLAETPQHRGAPMKALLSGLRVAEVVHEADGPPPWYDCDSPEDLDRAERWR